jgi:hypothetical protein
VTTALKWPSQDGQGSGHSGQGRSADGRPAPWPELPPPPRRSWFARDPAWPITALLVGWPLWWALGIGAYMPFFIAIPMAWRMYRWRATGSRRIKVPRGFGIWVLFLVLMVISVAMVSQSAPGTIPSPASHRVGSWALRAIQYFACTVILLYAGNLTERELSRRRLAWQLGLVAVYGIIFGFLDIALPGLSFSSPFAALVPSSIQQADPTIANMLHPALNQQHLFGGHGRPSAPFTYANWWGENVALVLPWLVVAWWQRGTRRQRRFAGAILAASIVPIILSFNRGLWVACVFAGIYLAVRFAMQGRGTMLGALLAGLVFVVIVVLATPLKGAITERLSTPGSATGRENLGVLTIKGVIASPMLGYGDTRHAAGSENSITLGRTAGCSECGNADVGVNGQIWLLMYTNGLPATIFYLSFFGYGIWRYRRDKSSYGMAGLLVLMLGFVFMWVYTQLGPPLAFTMLGYVLLWKNDREPPDQDALPEETGGSALQSGSRRAITAGGTNGTLPRIREA